MSSGANGRSRDLQQVAAATAVAIATVAMAAVVYLLLDVLLLLFLGIVLAAALQPWHARLCRWGLPKGLAVLAIYLFLFTGLVLIAVIVGPVLIEQINRFAADLPGTYSGVRSSLQASTTAPLHLIGQRLPPFERLTQALTGVAPRLYEGAVGVTTTIIKVPFFVVTVLAVAFYWTMELPRLERLLLSLLAVDRRARVLNIWHDIDSKLGAFMRGQGLAMLAIGVASAIGYALLGLPNVLALGVLAGVLEAVPLIGPVLAVVPAVLIAFPLGLNTMLLVIGLGVVLQVTENNVLIPRIMHHAVGVSALVGLLAVLAFGTLYGALGILIAIPMAAVIQVLLESLVVDPEPAAEPEGHVASPWVDLRARVRSIGQQARGRLRARTTRMGIDPETADHVVDAADQQIEKVAARVEKILSVAEENTEPLAAEERDAIVEKLHGATEQIEHAAERVDTIAATADESGAVMGPEPEPVRSEGAARVAEQIETRAVATAGWQSEKEPAVDDLERATRRIREAVEDVEAAVTAAKAEPGEEET